jgi:ABC-type multidrug transport system ATPase subunit
MQIGLENDADRKCKGYSRGMRRRLSVAMALIGDPKLIILDEPSREIDPTGKKHLWSTLQRLRRDNKIILIASPNVQECENLCSRIGLMINGRLQYVGTTPEIKKKFLNGYTVNFHLKKRFAVDDAGDLDFVGDIKANIEAILEDGVFREAQNVCCTIK